MIRNPADSLTRACASNSPPRSIQCLARSASIIFTRSNNACARHATTSSTHNGLIASAVKVIETVYHAVPSDFAITPSLFSLFYWTMLELNYEMVWGGLKSSNCIKQKIKAYCDHDSCMVLKATWSCVATNQTDKRAEACYEVQ